MIPASDPSALAILYNAEGSQRWVSMPGSEIAPLLLRVAERFLERGDDLADEIAKHMGVTPAEVWLEVIFPSVWGALSMFHAVQRSPARKSLDHSHLRSFAGFPAFQLMPGNLLERFLLPGFRGYVLFARPALAPKINHDELLKRRRFPFDVPEKGLSSPDLQHGLALCLLPFNLASIGTLDIIHLLCNRGMRVVAKFSEKAEFVGSYLESIFAPFVEAKALAFVYGGPEAGAWLATRPEISHVHLTGSARTAANLEKVARAKQISFELGGVTPAIVFPDSISTESRLRHTCRQIAFGALANNGQHCVSYQVAFVPESRRETFEGVLWSEMKVAARRASANGGLKLIDVGAGRHLQGLVEDACRAGASVTPPNPKADGRYFPACLISGINADMRIFREEAFGPVLGVMALPDRHFLERAEALMNLAELSGDLGASIFTAAPDSEEAQHLARRLKHGIVTINSYPGIGFATSLPWGAGAARLSGRGWVHNYQFLPEESMHKVVLMAPLGRKGFGPLCWEDPWLLNVSGKLQLDFARALVRLTLSYFKKQPWDFCVAQVQLMSALGRREWAARLRDWKK